jgi:hypothetical protein
LKVKACIANAHNDAQPTPLSVNQNEMKKKQYSGFDAGHIPSVTFV